MHAVILAGGKGVRLRPFTTGLPKPLVPIGDHHVILDIILQQLAQCGFRSATLAINHLGRLIRAYVGDGSAWGLEIDYMEESFPLSTCGPLFCIPNLPEHFLVMNGDLLTDLHFGDLLETHRLSGAPLTVATVTRTANVEFGVLDVCDHEIRGFREKPSMSYSVSTGIYGMSRSTIENYPPGLAYGFDQLIRDLIDLALYPHDYAFEGYWSDIGRPEDYDEANRTSVSLIERLIPAERQLPAARQVSAVRQLPAQQLPAQRPASEPEQLNGQRQVSA